MNENTTKRNYKFANRIPLQHIDFTKVFFTFKMSYISMLVKGKVIPITGLCGPEGG